MPHSFPSPDFIATNDIRMAVHERGEGLPVILLHGFPELAFSWRHQLPALADAGYRAIAPDMRGYGRTEAPEAVADYRIQSLAGDVTGLMDALGLDTATVVGHDWGALLAWHLAMTEPGRIDRLIALNIPLLPRPPVDPIAIMRERFGEDFYIVNFQDSDEADRTFGADPERFIDAMMRRNALTRTAYDSLPGPAKTISLLRLLERDEPAGEPLLSDDERRYYADAFRRTGFTGPINWYRNFTRNWESTADVEQRVRVPTLFIGAEDDVVISPEQIEAMRPLVDELELHMLEGCGHWSQQERPEDVNRLMLDWLERHPPADG